VNVLPDGKTQGMKCVEGAIRRSSQCCYELVRKWVWQSIARVCHWRAGEREVASPVAPDFVCIRAGTASWWLTAVTCSANAKVFS